VPLRRGSAERARAGGDRVDDRRVLHAFGEHGWDVLIGDAQPSKASRRWPARPTRSTRACWSSCPAATSSPPTTRRSRYGTADATAPPRRRAVLAETDDARPARRRPGPCPAAAPDLRHLVPGASAAAAQSVPKRLSWPRLGCGARPTQRLSRDRRRAVLPRCGRPTAGSLRRLPGRPAPWRRARAVGVPRRRSARAWRR
jgi:hypothetical protein